MSKLPLWLLDPKTYRAILAGLAVSSPLAFAQSYLPTSGALSISAINAIFSRGNNLNAYRGTTYYTSTTGPLTFSSGAISMSSFYGTGPTANRVAISYTFSSNTANASLNVSSIGGYSSGKSDITVTINSGVYLYSTSTGTPGFTISGGTSGDTITIVNNGFIAGKGGNGGTGVVRTGTGGGAGGTGLSLSTGVAVTVNNTNGSAYIGGGGGGAGNYAAGGGGAGAGDGGTNALSGAAGGSGGGPGSSGSNGALGGRFCCCGFSWYNGGGGGGGRIFPGSGGSGSSGGANGLNAAGGGGGGGGWGASGGNTTFAPGGPGGAGGKAVALNGVSITWTSGNTTRVYGSVS